MILAIIIAFVLVFTPTWFTPRVVAQAAQENYVFVQEFAPNEQFSNPDITIDKQTGNIYVADYFNNRVVKLNPSGNVITQWGTPGSAPGQFINPQDVNLTLLDLCM
jgi:DNA-binding beta-propeller fold protein YncE